MADNGVDVNKTPTPCTALTGFESQSKSPGRNYGLDESRKVGQGMIESLKNSIKAEAMPKYSACVRIEGPESKARRYLEESQVLRVLETLLTKLVHHQPDKPLEFLAEEIEQIKMADQQKKNSTTAGDKTEF